MYYDIRQRKVVKKVNVISKGIVGKMEDEELTKKVCELSRSIFENSLWRKNYSLEQAEKTINDEITKLIFRTTKHKPLIVFVPIEVNGIKAKN